VEFVPATTLVAMLANAHSDGTLDEQLTNLSRPKLLIIDELGSLPFEANATYLLFQLVSRRYEKGSILITSNRSVGERGSVFGDPIVAPAILDRLQGGSLHAKHATFDRDIALVESANLDIRSFVLNAEISLVFFASDVVAKLEDEQLRYFASSAELRTDVWLVRSFEATCSGRVSRSLVHRPAD
jgi:phosphatidylserine/phosphatidylglycerophosphate/cardiolipin synthase-like enzyme